VKSENRGKNLARRAWRMVEATSSILEPGLSPFPDSLSVLNGGLAAIFCVWRPLGGTVDIILTSSHSWHAIAT